MASLIDIGKSGLQSYRQALAVTGQNISNINTEGYKRRSADLEEVIANQGGISSTNAQTGLGVRVADIRRSFDEFLLNKARSATSYSETNEQFVKTLKQLEDILLPGDSNLGSMIANFFDGLQEIASSPADLAPRVAALERGHAVSNSFNQLAYLTNELKQGVGKWYFTYASKSINAIINSECLYSIRYYNDNFLTLAKCDISEKAFEQIKKIKK